MINCSNFTPTDWNCHLACVEKITYGICQCNIKNYELVNYTPILILIFILVLVVIAILLKLVVREWNNQKLNVVDVME